MLRIWVAGGIMGRHQPKHGLLRCSPVQLLQAAFWLLCEICSLKGMDGIAQRTTRPSSLWLFHSACGHNQANYGHSSLLVKDAMAASGSKIASVPTTALGKHNLRFRLKDILRSYNCSKAFAPTHIHGFSGCDTAKLQQLPPTLALAQWFWGVIYELSLSNRTQ